MSSVSLPRARGTGSTSAGRSLKLWQQLLLQLGCLFIAFTVLFPILWIVSMSLDPRDIARPTELQLIPPGASVKAYAAVLDRPTNNPVTFTQLATNSFMLAGGVSAFAVLIGVSAAYAFSRMRFKGRQWAMIGVLAVTNMPAIATIAPLFVMLNGVRVSSGMLSIFMIVLGALILISTAFMVIPSYRDGSPGWGTIAITALGVVLGGYLLINGFQAGGGREFNLRDSLLGVGLAMISGALPFAIWNLKGFLDTIPKELEEAAIIDGATSSQTFFRIILPLAAPALAVTGFLGFMGGWTEFFLSWQFLTQPKDFTLAMALWNMTGQYAGSVPWSRFAAFSILISLPVSVIYLLLQRWIVGGLTLGGVKG